MRVFVSLLVFVLVLVKASITAGLSRVGLALAQRLGPLQFVERVHAVDVQVTVEVVDLVLQRLGK
jgi:hypothetical protein